MQKQISIYIVTFGLLLSNCVQKPVVTPRTSNAGGANGGTQPTAKTLAGGPQVPTPTASSASQSVVPSLTPAPGGGIASVPNAQTAAAAASTAATTPAIADGSPSAQAIVILNTMRAQRGLPAVQVDLGLTQRCQTWADYMNSSNDLDHDPSVYGTDEREDIVGGGSETANPQESMSIWLNSPPHAAAMFDQNGFATAVMAGYAESGTYACLRLCPADHASNVCNG